MPTFTDKDGKQKFSMNPQIGKALIGAPSEAGQEQSAQTDDGDGHIELHKGGHPEGEPPAHEGTQYHTIHHNGMGPEIRNHDSYDEADDHMRSCMEGGSEQNGDEENYDGGEE